MAPSAPSVWKQKFTTLFKRFDKGDKGHVTKDDINAQISAFTTKGYLNSQETEEMKVIYEKLWKLFLNGNESVTLDQWIEGHLLLISPESTDVWEDTLKPAGSLMFKAADKEKKGVISAEEFAVYLECLGVDDGQCAKDIFNKIDVSGKGVIREEEFLIAFHDFNYNKEETPSQELMGPLVR